jgi:hypothetical protein
MVGRFNDFLHFQPGQNNLLIVRGPLIAQNQAELSAIVRIEATLTQGDNSDTCNSNGDRFSPGPDPGSTWTMNLHTSKLTLGDVTGTATAFDANNQPVMAWTQLVKIT